MKILRTLMISILLCSTAQADHEGKFKLYFTPADGAEFHQAVIIQNDTMIITDLDNSVVPDSNGDITTITDVFPIIGDQVSVSVAAVYSNGDSFSSNTFSFPSIAFAAPIQRSFYIFSSDYRSINGAMSLGDMASAIAGDVLYPNSRTDDKNGSQLTDFAVYDINIPISGEWKFWVRMRAAGDGTNNAANSFWMKFDEYKTRLGNNPIFDEWFWDGNGWNETDILPVDLGFVTEGMHTLTIYKREADGVMLSPGIDILFFTNTDVVPTDALILGTTNTIIIPTTTIPVVTTTTTTTTIVPQTLLCDLDYDGKITYTDLQLLVPLIEGVCR